MVALWQELEGGLENGAPLFMLDSLERETEISKHSEGA